jgi:hypothetical protein
MDFWADRHHLSELASAEGRVQDEDVPRIHRVLVKLKPVARHNVGLTGRLGGRNEVMFFVEFLQRVISRQEWFTIERP